MASTWRSVFADAGASANDRYRLSDCFAVADEATAVQVNLGHVAEREASDAGIEEGPAPAG